MMKTRAAWMVPLFVLALACLQVEAATRPGDADGDGEVTPADEQLLLDALFESNVVPGLDTNEDGGLTVADLVRLQPLLLAPFWEMLAPLPEPRQEVGGTELDGRVYVIGGFDRGGSIVATVEYYDVIADRWSRARPLPEALHHVPAVSVGGRLYTLGGLRGFGFIAVAAAYAYDPASDTWETRASLPTARGAGAVAVIDGLIYLAGGFRGGSVNDFAVYDPAANEWTILPSMPTARDHLGAAAIDGIFYAVGGRAGRLFDTLEAYDPESATWRTDLAPMPTARGGLAAAALHGRLFALGGEGNPRHPFGIFPQAEAYDPESDQWETLPEMLTPRHGMSAAPFRGRIIVPGGAIVQGFGASAANEALTP
jgi:hypothetical protein